MTDDVDTDPFRMSHSDRLAVENRVDKLQATLDQYKEDRAAEIERFYIGRMVPLEKDVASARSTSHVAIGVAACAFVLTIVVLIAVLVLHYG